MKQVTDISRIVLILAVVFVALSVSVDAQTQSMLFFGQSGEHFPEYYWWQITQWGLPDSCNDVSADVRWLVAQSCPTRDETVVATSDIHSDLNVQFFDGTDWTTAAELTGSISGTTTRGYDFAYESLSGDLLAVYRTGLLCYLRYNSWDGSNWLPPVGGGTVVPIGANTILRTTILRSNPLSDEIILLAQTFFGISLQAAVWDGIQFGNATQLAGLLADTEKQCFDACYLEVSNSVLTVWSEVVWFGVSIRYRIWDGSNWSLTQTITGYGNDPVGIGMITVPGSDSVLLASVDNSRDLYTITWDGSAWGSWQLLDNNVHRTTRDIFDLAFEHNSGTAVIVYGHTSQSAICYRTWSGGVWNSQLVGPNVGESIYMVDLYEGEADGEVICLIGDVNRDLNSLLWSGSSWGSPQEVTSNLPSTLIPSFAISNGPSAGTSNNINIVRWRERFR